MLILPYRQQHEFLNLILRIEIFNVKTVIFAFKPAYNF